jgi:hypothetical protein
MILNIITINNQLLENLKIQEKLFHEKYEF